jgi:glycosyltransferase involved in cell wall biosynthesis
MILGIDAFNLRRGGGITHLVELLRAADPQRHGFDKVILWGGAETLSKVDARPWLEKVREPMLDRSLPFRIFWHRVMGRRRARQAQCDIVFLPGGTASNGFSPVVTMCRNMLPFEWRELARYGWSWGAVKLMILRWTQTASFRNADGLIFLTEHARKVVGERAGLKNEDSITIPHGISARFFHPPRKPRDNGFTWEDPCRVLYVSIVSPYKHQWHVVRAVAKLRSEGVPVTLELIGPQDSGIGRLQQTINAVDPAGDFIAYRGAVAYEALEQHYAAADIGVFASSCENMPNILLEGMAAGLPMACSRLGPMPEILGDAGEYFNPLNYEDIAISIRRLIESSELRARHAQSAHERAKRYSWERCASETLAYLSAIVSKKL